MKKLFILVAAIGLLSSCANSQKDKEAASVTEFNDIVDNIDKDHSPMNALDYEGTYDGVLPTASGEGMEVIITLGSNDTFKKTVTYIGKENSTFEESGTYSWNEAGNIITLNGIDKPNQYSVGENRLIQLDINGEKITGELADNYILKK